MTPSDEEDEAGRGRDSDQREASESRMRKLIAKVSGERRDEFWLRLGFDVSSERGLDRLVSTLSLPAALGIDVTDPDDVKTKREALAWAERAQQRAATLGKRLLGWITFGIGTVGGLVGIIKYVQEWRGH